MEESIKKNPVELSEEELSDVTGGAGSGLVLFACPKCGNIFQVSLDGTSAHCPLCGTVTRLDG